MSDIVLKQLRESWLTLTEEKKEETFCYMLYVSPEDENPFVDLQKNLKLTGELIESGKFHATVRYVKSEKDPRPFIEFLKSQDLNNIEATCKGFEIYGVDKDTLVVELEGKKIHDWFNKVNDWLVDHGYPKSDYPEYKPHISLTEKKDIEKPEWKKEYEQKVKFKIHVVTDTDREEIFRSIC